MKVIFLDHDGVICLSTEWGSRFDKQKKWGGRKLSMTSKEIPLQYRLDNFNKDAIKVLNNILEKTDAEIVVSSDWRFHASLDELKQYYTSQGIIKEPISVTKRIDEIDRKMWERDFRNYAKLEQERALEIKSWLKEYPEVTSWVSIDDLKMGKFQTENNLEFVIEWGLENFVLTNDKFGLNEVGIDEKILYYLK